MKSQVNFIKDKLFSFNWQEPPSVGGADKNRRFSLLFDKSASNNLLLQETIVDNKRLSCRTIMIDNKEKLLFGSCSYLGLETDRRLIDATEDAIEKYGVQFATSRALLSLDIYDRIEEALFDLFGAYAVITQTTTLGDIAAFSALLGKNDTIILDQQTHNSMKMALGASQIYSDQIVKIKHNDMNELEEKIITARTVGTGNVWYVADGVYSMSGDTIPIEDISILLDKYDNFFVYIDDAHGISWTGYLGRGHVLGHCDIHPRMVIAASFAKAFGTGGAAILLPHQQWQKKLRTTGPTLIFSGPLQPAVLGAIEASLRIHLSGDITELQEDLNAKIIYFSELLAERNIVCTASDLTPIFYIVIGTVELAQKVVTEILARGYYVNYISYPIVAKGCSGMRITLNCHLSKSDILNFANVLQELFCKYKIGENSNSNVLEFVA